MLLLVTFFFLLTRHKASDDRADRIVIRFIVYPLLLLFFVVGLIIGYKNFQDWRCIHAQVSTDSIKVVEGEVTDYDHDSAWKKNGARDDFRVEGVHFVYGYTDSRVPIGYSKNAREGGYIRGNGQYVRLSYVTLDNGKNVILRIEAPATE